MGPGFKIAASPGHRMDMSVVMDDPAKDGLVIPLDLLWAVLLLEGLIHLPKKQRNYLSVTAKWNSSRYVWL